MRQLIPSLIIAACFCALAHGQSTSIDYSTTNVPGRLYIPDDLNSSYSPRPLILGLHGSGGVGTNSGYLFDFSSLISEANDRSAFLYLPQATTILWHPQQRAEAIIDQIEKAIAERDVDPHRIYITGFSMGGGGVWDLLNLFPETFAAAIPICAISPRTGSIFNETAGTPIWAFHARNDPSVSVTTTRNMINGFLNTEQIPNPTYPSTGTYFFDEPRMHLRYTEYATGGHFIWNQVWQTEEHYNWLFAQSKESSDPPSISNARINYFSEGQEWSILFQTNATDQEFQSSTDLATWSEVPTTTPAPGTRQVTIDTPTLFIRPSP